LLAQSNPPQLKSSVDQSTIAVGDVVKMRLEVQHPESFQAKFPDIESQLGEWSVRGKSLLPPAKSQPGWITETLELNLAIYKVGEFQIPALAVELTAANGDKTSLQSELVKIKVQSVITDNAKELKEIKPQAELPTDYQWILILAAILAALALAAFFIWRRWKKRQQKPLPGPAFYRSPEDLARDAIRILLAKELPAQGQFKEFYLELSEIVKKYLGIKLEVISLERTTEEFITDLRTTVMPWDQVQAVRDFLMDCDLVKFAKYLPAEDEVSRIVQRALEVIDAAERRLKAAIPVSVEGKP
jgi:hypothetical protein